MSYLLSKGIELYHRGDLLESIRYLESCVKDCQESGDGSTAMLALSNLSEAYMRLGKFKNAEMSSVELLLLSREQKSTADEIRAIGRMAMAVSSLRRRSQYNDLCGQLEESINSARHINLYYWVVQNLETLGVISLEISDISKSLEYFQMALNATKVKIKNNFVDQVEGDFIDEVDLFRTRINGGIARCFSKLRRFKQAHMYADIAITIALETGKPHVIATATLCKANVSLESNELNDALRYATDVKTRALREGWKYEEFVAQKLLISIYRTLNNYEDAYESALRALALAEELVIDEDASLIIIELVDICQFLDKKIEIKKYIDYGKQIAIKLENEKQISLLLTQTQKESNI